MFKFVLFVLAAVAGSCFVACEDKTLSEACSPTLGYMKEEGDKMENEEGYPECAKKWKADYNPSGVTNLPEYVGGMMKWMSEVNDENKDKIKECGEKFGRWMPGKMEEMKEKMIKLGTIFNENTECLEKLMDMGTKILNEL